jgi:hypothetical protein
MMIGPLKRYAAAGVVIGLLVGHPVGAQAPVELAPAQPLSEAGDMADTQRLPEPDYAEVAADARRIADEIEERRIEAHMEDAAVHLQVLEPAPGHAKAEEAYRDMEEMIKFCEAAGAGAGSTCRFRLEIKMGLNAGNTLAQLTRGLNPGQGAGGGMGQGAGGQSGGQSQFGMFGPEPFGRNQTRSSRLGDRKTKSDALAEPWESKPSTTVHEEQASGKKESVDYSVRGDAPIVEQYRPLIEGYFKRLTEDQE